MSDERANQLELPLVVDQNTESHGTAFTVSVEARYACWFGRAPSSACWFGWAPSGATPRYREIA